MTQLSAPLQQNERADILDVLRGFALLGVLLDNIMVFTGYVFFSQEYRESLPGWPVNGILSLAETAFVSGKFYSLFSLLFGIGFAIIFMRNQQKGINPLKIFYRRIFVLLIIGWVHLRLLWLGDILVLYALLALFLPLFNRCKDKTLLIWALALIAAPILLDSIYIISGIHPGAFLYSLGGQINIAHGLSPNAIFSQYLYTDTAGWAEWRNIQASGYVFRFGHFLETSRIPKVMGMFLLGLYAGRKMIYARLDDYVALFKRLRTWGFLIGIPAGIAMAFFSLDDYSLPQWAGLSDTFFYAISVAPLSLAYASSICLVWIRTRGQGKLKWLAPMGRMALTNYLMQTIICVFLFYGVGLNLGGAIGPVVFFPIAIVIYGLQVVYSQWWMKRFHYGPFEWVWRMLTYGKRLSFRKKSSG